MQIPQLIFGSTNRGSIRGYHLLGRSNGIDERFTKEFCRWAPSHGALQDTAADASSLNFFPLEPDKFVVARSIYGGPEYSGRGGLQVMTIALLMEEHQLEYYHSPLEIAETAISLGHLILPSSVRSVLLPVTLPRRSLGWSPGHSGSGCEELLVETLRLINSDHKVVVVGAEDPSNFLDQLFSKRGDHDLEKLSFSTGLKPSVSRDFRIQFLSSANEAQIRQLQSQRYVCLHLHPAVL